MGDRFLFLSDTIGSEEHPAVAAWCKLEPHSSMPDQVDVLRTNKGKVPGQKSTVYRLSGAGRDGESIIGKLSKRSSVHTEALVYREMLPQLPLRSVYCYGTVDESDDQAWIFLEEIRGSRFDEEQLDHRCLAAKWLATVHMASTGLAGVDRLPVLALDRHLSDLRLGRKKIERNVGNAALCREDDVVLERIVEHCDALEARWSEIEAFCATAPKCLVHGDFISKNVKVRLEKDAGVLYAIDWERAGWGVPVEDLGGLDQTIADFGGIDIETYRQEVRPMWSSLDRPSADRLVHIGIIFRYLAWIQATSSGLHSDWVDGTVASLRSYSHRLGLARQFAELA